MELVGRAGHIAPFAHFAFWLLVVYGSATAFGLRRGVLFVCVYVASYLALSRMQYGLLWFVPVVAVLDIIMAFMIMKNDAWLR